MTMPSPIAISLLCAALFLAGCGASSTSKAAISAGPRAVSIRNFAFAPAATTIRAGSRVTWTNHDSVNHTVTSTTGTTFGSSVLHHGSTFAFTFNTPGVYHYHCSFHPFMTAMITVTR